MDPYTDQERTIQSRIFAAIEAEARLTLEAHGMAPAETDSALREIVELVCVKVAKVSKSLEQPDIPSQS